MAENIALEVKFQGETQIYSPSYRTSWEDLHAMLKCSFEVDDLAVYYLDDENEEIAIDSQEEYDEAKKISEKFHSVLQLRVYPRNQQPEVGTALDVEAPDQTETQPIPIPSARPKSSPQLIRAQSLPDDQHTSVTVSVRRAVEELKEMNLSESQLEPSPATEKALIDRIVRGVLDGLDTSIQDRSKPHSWDPSLDTRPPSCSSPQPGETRTKPKSRSRSKGPILEHPGITCNNCTTVIAGIRFKCGHCLDYDLCEECEALSGIHDPNHVFLKLKRPAFRVGMKSDGRMAPIFKHPVYADDDTPVWEYKIKKLEEKMARKAARAELKRKYREEKRRVKQECHGQVSPMKRERIERMAEQQAEQIMAAASQDVTPVNRMMASLSMGNSGASPVETTPLLVRKFDASFVRDGNLPDETHMQPKTKFVKSWILKNTGNVPWNCDTKLKYLWGDIKFLSADPMEIPLLTPGEEGPICVDFEAPAKPGNYHSHWRLTQSGEQFGHRIWCNIIVDKAEVLEPTCEKKKTVQEEMVLTKVQESAPAQGDCSENTPSSAVAHLQTGQSDTAAPSRVVSSSDVLTAQDVLSFELLNIHDDQEADKEVEGVNSPAATTTPNNTPIVGLTPCISPVPQLDEKLLCRRVSEHSDLEFVRREDIPEIVETPEMVSRDGPVSDKVQDGVEFGTVYCDNEDGVESIGSSTDSDILDDYYVVPLPDCFDPSKPIDKSMLLSKTSLSSSVSSSVTLQSECDIPPVVRLPSYEESQAESMSSSPSLSVSALPPKLGDVSKETPSITTDEKNVDVASDTEESNVILIDAEERETEPEAMTENAVNACDQTVDSLLGTLSHPALETNPLIPLVASSPVQQLSTSPPPKSTSPSPQTVAMAPMPEITLLATPAEAPTTSEGGVLINPDGNVVFQASGQPEIVQQTSASNASDGTNIDIVETAPQPQEISEIEREPERPEEHDDEFHDAQDAPTEHRNAPSDPQGVYTGVQFQAQSDPVDLLGYTAARAVEVAGSVVRQAFDTAANSVGALLRPQPVPMPGLYQPPPPPAQTDPPARPATAMEQLIEMGFANRARNQELLDRHNDDVSRCVQDLLQEEDNNWHNNRH